MCGALRSSDAGKKAVLMGWVNRRRDLGNIIFIDLRDRTGVTQVVFNKELNPAAHAKAETLRNEYVLAVTGTVKQRDPATVNKNIPTGEVELMNEELRILNESKQLPFLPGDTVLPNEEMRLKYRYIDLRREAMQFNLEMRHKVSQAIRGYLCQQGFLEIETPFMTRSTPEGARDYLVPSRVQPGSFYALPQSPQMFKQILMISGCERYFQIVRCFRDEDLRADRQPEFTQIDLEMSYPQPEQVYAVVEGFLTAAFKAAGHEIKTPFLRMTYDESMRLYGNDKPDMRLPAMVDVRAALTPEELEEVTAKFRIRKELPWQLIRIPKAGDISGTERRTIGTYGAYQHVQGPSFVQLMTDPKRFRQGLSGDFREGAELCESRSRRSLAAGRRAEQAGSRGRSRPGRAALLREVRISCASTWRRNTPRNTARSRRPAIPRRISASSGSPTSPCSPGTKTRSAGIRRTIPSPRCTKRTWPSSKPTLIRCAIPNLRWEKFARWPTTWC